MYLGLGLTILWMKLYCLSFFTLITFEFLCSDNLLTLCRDVDLTEKLDYSSAVALIGYSLILAIFRAFSVRVEAARVIIAAPILAFVMTHILYLNLYELHYGNFTSRNSLLTNRFNN